MMAISTVSPFDVQRAIADARRRGGPADYYGLGAALNGFNSAYQNLGRDVLSANDAIRTNEVTNAQLDSGYAALNQEGINSDIRKRVYNNQQQMAMTQAIEEAHREAAGKGLRAGTPEYQLFMRDYLSGHGPYNAAMGMVPAADKATTQLRNEAIAKQFIKKSLENYTVRKMAEGLFKERIQDANVTPADYPMLQKQALDEAKKHIDDQGFQVVFDPDGTIRATDKYQADQPIPPQALGAALAMMGDAGPMKILQQITDQYLKSKATEAQMVKVAAAADKGGATPKAAAPTKPVPDPMRVSMENEFKLRMAHAKAFIGKELNADDRKDRDENAARLAELQKQLYGAPSTPSAATPAYDPNSVISAAQGAPAPVATDAPPNYLYGAETGAETSRIPDVNKAPWEEPTFSPLFGAPV